MWGWLPVVWLVVLTGLGLAALLLVTRSGINVTEQRPDEPCGGDRS